MSDAKTPILCCVADLALEDGDVARTQELLAESLQIYRVLMDPVAPEITEVYRDVPRYIAVAAKLAAAQQDPLRAAHLFAAAEALYRAQGAIQMPDIATRNPLGIGVSQSRDTSRRRAPIDMGT